MTRVKSIFAACLMLPLAALSLYGCGGGGGGGSGGGSSSSSASSSSSSSSAVVAYTAGVDIAAKTQASTWWSQSTPVQLKNGNLVLVWVDTSADLGDLKAQIYDTNGNPVGSEITVATYTDNRQVEPEVAAMDNGGFIVVYRDESTHWASGISTEIVAQLFDASGAKAGAEFKVNSAVNASQYTPHVARLNDGRLVVTWNDNGSISAIDYSIKAQILNADGTKSGNVFTVAENPSITQNTPVIAALSNGGFAITWYTTSTSFGDNTKTEVYAQAYDASGAKVGSTIQVNTNTTLQQWFPKIAGLSGGGFVIVWEDLSGTLGDTSNAGVHAQIFGNDGARVGSEFLVNTNTFDDQFYPAVAAMTNGYFVVTWQDNSKTLGDTATSIIKAQVFTAAGVKAGSEFLVNTPSSNDKIFPTVGGLSNGRFAISWKDHNGVFGSVGSNETTHIRIYNPS